MQSSYFRNFLVASEPWKQSLCTPWLPSKCGIIQFSLVWNGGELCWIITSVWANILGAVFAASYLGAESENQPRLELWKALVQRTRLCEYLYVYTLRAYDLSISLSVVDYGELVPLTLLCFLYSSCLSSLSIALLTVAAVAAGNSWFWPGSHR